MELVSTYATMLSIFRQTTSMGLVGAYAFQKSLLFASHSAFVIIVYVVYMWVSRSRVLDPL